MGPTAHDEVFRLIAEKSKEYSKLDPELEKIIQKQGLPKPFIPQRDNMAFYRRIATASTGRFMRSPFVQTTLSLLPHQNFRTVDMQIPTTDGTSIGIRVYHPEPDHSETLPVLVMVHGGGWCLGGLDTDAFACELICRSIGMIVVDVDYRRAPEVKHATIVADVYAAVQWVAVNASTVGGDLRKGFLTAGISGGGNLTTAVTYLARDDNLQPPLTGTVLMATGMPQWSIDKHGNELDLYPGRLKSWDEHKEFPISGHAVSTAYGDLAEPDIFSPLFSPFNAGHHRDLPPLYYQVCGLDTWRDSAILYTHLVREAGGTGKLDVYPGLPHTFWAFYPQVSAAQNWALDLVDGVRWLLEQGKTRATAARL